MLCSSLMSWCVQASLQNPHVVTKPNQSARCTNLLLQNPGFENVFFYCFNILGPPLINKSFKNQAGVQMRKKGEKLSIF